MQVAKWLEAASVDVIEISGGTYEQPRLLGVKGIEEVCRARCQSQHDSARAYFLEFAIALRQSFNTTHGHRRLPSKTGYGGSFENGADIIGLGHHVRYDRRPSRLFSGLAELPRYESELTFFPTWLNFLNRFKSLRTLQRLAFSIGITRN